MVAIDLNAFQNHQKVNIRLLVLLPARIGAEKYHLVQPVAIKPANALCELLR